MPVLQRSEGAGVADGVSHSLHQGDWWSSRQGRSVSGPEEWTGEYSSMSSIRHIICMQTQATSQVMTLRWVSRAGKGFSPPWARQFPFMRIASGQRLNGPQTHSMPHSGRVGTAASGLHIEWINGLESPRRGQICQRCGFSGLLEREAEIVPQVRFLLGQ